MPWTRRRLMTSTRTYWEFHQRHADLIALAPSVSVARNVAMISPLTMAFLKTMVSL